MSKDKKDKDVDMTKMEHVGSVVVGCADGVHQWDKKVPSNIELIGDETVFTAVCIGCRTRFHITVEGLGMEDVLRKSKEQSQVPASRPVPPQLQRQPVQLQTSSGEIDIENDEILRKLFGKR